MQTNLSVFIVYHDKASFDLFQENNKHIDTSKLKYILVGDWDGVGEIAHDNHIVAASLPNNLEKYKTLLAFTAWWGLTKNNLINTPYVGIFEYDVIFKKDIFELEEYLDQDSIIGFCPRQVKDDAMYLDLLPKFCELLEANHVVNAKAEPLWNASSNMIMPKWFTYGFVSWYINLMPELIKLPGHSHYHERAVNVFASNFDMKYTFKSEYLKHKQLMSHGIDFVQY